MGKPFNSELQQLEKTVRWADLQDVKSLRQFLCQRDTSIPMVCIGSGGSLSACNYASYLYKQHNGVLAEAMTPLQLMYSGVEVIRNSKLLFLSASGKNKDILNAIKYGVKLNETGMMSLTLRKNNPMECLLARYPKVSRWCEDIPSGRDGFLATNSLVATFALLSRSYDEEPVRKVVSFDGSYSCNSDFNLSDIQDFVVLYGAASESVAWDIESKLTEAALGSTLLSDYRNFGHGRHHWFDKRCQGSCIIALVTPIEHELARKTISYLPKGVPVIYIESELDAPKASIELLIKAFRLVKDLGMARGIDPGRPGVPSYGRMLYNLNYFKLIDRILPAEDTLYVAVRRKLGNAVKQNHVLFEYYETACKTFIRRLNKTKFTTIAFDYDGTLSASDHDSRHSKGLCEDIKNALLLLLKNGAQIAVATGRGKSVGESFKNSFDHKYWPQVKIGYYNGACCLPLGKEAKLEEWKNQPLDKDLDELEKELKRRIPAGCINYKFEERNQQLSIEGTMTSEETQFVCELCREIIWDLQLRNICVWRSSHSMDIVVYREVSKRHVIEDEKHTLCIGDYGSVEGNDYEILTSEFSLSVDKVSKSGDNCWNLAPAGVKGLDATLYYLSRVIIDGKCIKINCRI